MGAVGVIALEKEKKTFRIIHRQSKLMEKSLALKSVGGLGPRLDPGNH